MTNSIFKRTSFMALAVMVATPLFAGDKAVNWWYESANPSQQEALSTHLIDKFNASDKDHNLIIDYRGDALTQQLRVALLSGTGPDLVQTPGPSFVAAMARAGQL